MRNTIVILLCFCIPLMTCLDKGHSIQANSQDALDNYGIVIDAGSSGTRVHLYHQTSTFDFKEIVKACKIKTPLTDFEKNPENSHEEITKCLAKDTFISHLKGKEDKTLVLLGATAGMRMLNFRNSKAFLEILNSLKKNLNALPYRVAYVGKIYGSQEAYYAWMTVNQLNGYFKNHHLNPSLKQRSIGALDLGGASTQIAFLDRNPPFFQDGSSYLTVFGKKYQVFGISLLCSGLDMVKSRVLAQILKDNNFASECENPCTLTGDVMKVPKKIIFQNPCVYGNGEEFGLNIPPPANAPNEYTFKGKMNIEKCREYLIKTFDSKHARNVRKKLYQGVLKQGEFYAMSAYYFTVKALGLPQKHSRSEFKAKLNKHCTTPAGAEGTDTNYKEHPKWTCMAGIYMKLLLEFLRIDHLWKNIDFTDQVKGTSVNWALGFMMENVGVLKTKRQQYKHKK